MPAVGVTGGSRSPRVLVGRYRLESFIAGGGMAEVWEGYDTLLARPVAVKLPLAHLARQQVFLERFRREAVAAARLTHPNVVAVYDTGTDDGDAFIVMELVEGVSLRERLRAEGRVALSRAVDIAAQVAGALDFAHRAGVIHRDIKPANILINADGVAKVTDFGIAKAVLGADLTETNVTLGTARYISPEQAEGRRPDGRSDVYSLGVVLYEMLCGRPPFEADNELGIALQHVRKPPPPPSSVERSVPPWLEAVVLKALAKDPDARYASAAQMRSVLVAGPAVTDRPRPVPAATAGQGGAAVDQEDTRAHVLEPEGADAELPGLGPPPRGGGHAAGPDVDTGWLPGRGAVTRRLESERSPESRWYDESPEQDRQHERERGRPSRARQSRRLLPLLVAVILLAALAAAVALITRSDHRSSSSAPPRTSAAAPSTIPVVGELAFDPPSDGGDGHEDDAGLPNLLSTAPGTYWQTEYYFTRRFGNLKPGVGFVLELQGNPAVSHVSLYTPTPGWNASVYLSGSPQSTIQQWGAPVTSQSGLQGHVTFDLGSKRAGAVLVWITELGPDLTVKVNSVQVTS